MTNPTIEIVELFGEFAVKINGKIESFATRNQALAAVVASTRAAEFEAAGKEFAATLVDLSAKGQKAQSNVVVAYLTWNASQELVDSTEGAPIQETAVEAEVLAEEEIF